MKVLALAKYGDQAASTRQRIMQYAAPFAQAGIALDCEPLLGNDYVRSLTGHSRMPFGSIAAGYVSRFASLMRRSEHDAYWVYADLFPYLPAAFDNLLFRHGKPVVVEWDDAFFETYASHSNPLVRALFGSKLDRLLRRADAMICGNRFLYDHAAGLCDRRIIVPTVVDTDIFVPGPKRGKGSLTIGWIGSPSTWTNCRPILPLVARVCERFDARFRIVGAGRVPDADRHPRFDFIDWSLEDEVVEVQGFDVGIMPLLDEPFQRGKSGYKLIQYMACAVAGIASPVGVNAEIFASGESGLLASSDDEWERALETLLSDPARRVAMGRAGRAQVEAEFSLRVQAPRLIALFNGLVPR